mmetsp:Transcript_29373/g.64345  ORF Transcript_29373/g.64345 Transcript_29373/m.64345 type:complete len:206 (+) Transcript_29373:99-716(+)
MDAILGIGYLFASRPKPHAGIAMSWTSCGCTALPTTTAVVDASASSPSSAAPPNNELCLSKSAGLVGLRAIAIPVRPPPHEPHRLCKHLPPISSAFSFDAQPALPLECAGPKPDETLKPDEALLLSALSFAIRLSLSKTNGLSMPGPSMTSSSSSSSLSPPSSSARAAVSSEASTSSTKWTFKARLNDAASDDAATACVLGPELR